MPFFVPRRLKILKRFPWKPLTDYGVEITELSLHFLAAVDVIWGQFYKCFLVTASKSGKPRGNFLFISCRTWLIWAFHCVAKCVMVPFYFFHQSVRNPFQRTLPIISVVVFVSQTDSFTTVNQVHIFFDLFRFQHIRLHFVLELMFGCYRQLLLNSVFDNLSSGLHWL